MTSTDGYEFLDHTADVILHGWATTNAGLFNQLGLALMAWMTKENSTGAVKAVRHLEMSAVDEESLLVDWLSALLTLALTEGLLFKEASFTKLHTGELAAETSFYRGAIEDEVKAITYHGLSFVREGGLLSAKVTLDL